MGRLILTNEEITDALRAITERNVEYDVKTKEFYLEERIIPRKKEGFLKRVFG